MDSSKPQVDFRRYGIEYLDIKSVLIDMLQAGFADLKTDSQNYIVNVFRRDPLLAAGSEAMKTEIPCVCINRIADEETNQFIGEAVDEDPDTGNLQMGRFYNEVFELRVWSTSAQWRDEIYKQLKRIVLIGKREYIENRGGYLVRISNGVDEADHQFLNGTPCFWATMHLSVLNGFVLVDGQPVEPITNIEVIESITGS